MGMNRQRLLSLVLLVLGAMGTPARADSPLTSMPIADAYLDIPLVRTARTKGVLTPEMAEFLSGPHQPVDCQAALINALSWRVEGKQNVRICEQFLGNRYGEWNLVKFTPDEVFAVAYLTVMDGYFAPSAPCPLRNRQIVALMRIRAQMVMTQAGEWCRV